MLLGSALETNAQILFQGKVIYNRKLNLHRQFDDLGEEYKPYLENILKQIPKFDEQKFTLLFNAQNTIYSPIKKEPIAAMAMMGGVPGIETISFTNFKTQQITSSKKVFDQTFLLQDSIKKFDWKIHDEIRTIAGYPCRKATTKYCDSVVIVAFYAENIVNTGGPELFSGLPGLILEIAIPRLYTTWIAESVIIEQSDLELNTAPQKGKQIRFAEAEKTLKQSMKNWGNFADKSIWWTLL
jgi:GLPGLI family protein